MQLKTAVLAAVLVACAAGAASAQKLSIGPTGGLTFPMGDFGDVSKSGFHIGATADYALAAGFAVGGDVVWHRASGKDDFEKLLSAENGVPTDVTFDIIPVTVHAKYTFPGAVGYHPFLRAGLGIYHVGRKVDPETSRLADHSENKFGVNLGGGTTLMKTGPLSLGVEAALHIISTSGTSTNLVTVSGTALFGSIVP